MNNKIEIAKRTLSLVASFGAGKIAHTVIKNNVQPQNTIDQVTMAVGAFALGGAVGNVARDHMERTVDEIVAAYNAFTNKS